MGHDLGATAEVRGGVVKDPAADVGADAHTPRLGYQRAHHAEGLAFFFYAGVQDALGVVQNEGNALAALDGPDAQEFFTVPVKVFQPFPYGFPDFFTRWLWRYFPREHGLVVTLHARSI